MVAFVMMSKKTNLIVYYIFIMWFFIFIFVFVFDLCGKQSTGIKIIVARRTRISLLSEVMKKSRCTKDNVIDIYLVRCSCHKCTKFRRKIGSPVTKPFVSCIGPCRDILSSSAVDLAIASWHESVYICERVV